jgi:hypothetical protein
MKPNNNKRRNKSKNKKQKTKQKTKKQKTKVRLTSRTTGNLTDSAVTGTSVAAGTAPAASIAQGGGDKASSAIAKVAEHPRTQRLPPLWQQEQSKR